MHQYLGPKNQIIVIIFIVHFISRKRKEIGKTLRKIKLMSSLAEEVQRIFLACAASTAITVVVGLWFFHHFISKQQPALDVQSSVSKLEQRCLELEHRLALLEQSR